MNKNPKKSCEPKLQAIELCIIFCPLYFETSLVGGNRLIFETGLVVGNQLLFFHNIYVDTKKKYYKSKLTLFTLINDHVWSTCL